LAVNKLEKKAYIYESHKRCMDLGIEFNMVLSRKILDGKEFEDRLDLNKELILNATPFVNQLYNFVKGSNFFATLTDETGCILNVIGDEDILSEAFKLKMIPGAYMDEEDIGTNAISLALTEKMPIQVSGDEHYIKVYQRWTCSAAPIKNKSGQVIGVLSLTGYSEAVHSHTLGMIVAAVNTIQKIIENNKNGEALKASKQYIEAAFDSVESGILTSDLRGNIKTINKHIYEMFGYSENELKHMNMSELVENLSSIVDIVVNKGQFWNEEVYINARKNKLQFNLSVYPILNSENIFEEITYVFMEVKKTRKTAGKISGCKAIYTFDKIVGKNKEFINIIEYAKKISDSRSTILITGESGTGKEIFAQSIHNFSDRKGETFVAVNCGAIPRNLIESELFGYEEGAFTGAKRGGNAGKFEIADGGTIFLDEIGEMPLDMQTRLLRVIEEGVISRIGSSKQLYVNVRIIAATNKDLKAEAEKGNFRKDLFYRLNVLPIHLPSLRNRRDDIPLLINYFMKKISKHLNKRMVYIDDIQLNYFINYNWPGNIRELENIVELIINTESVPIDILQKDTNFQFELYDLEDECLKLEYMEMMHIIKVLKKYNGNVAFAAKALGIGRNTLYRKISNYSIDRSIIEQSSGMEQGKMKNVPI